MARMLHTSIPRGPHGGWLDEFSALGDPMFLSLHTGTIQSRTESPVHGSLAYYPEQVHGQVFRSGDSVTVEWTDPIDQITDPHTWLGGSLVDTTITWDGLGVEGSTEGELDDEPYPCQLCWATARWPWEPLRACPSWVDVGLTYCARHRP